MSGTIAVINGPNLNLLGKREPEFYGKDDPDSIISTLEQEAAKAGFSLWHIQSNSEGELLNAIQGVLHDVQNSLKAPSCQGLIINAGAYTHSSIAIRDALAGSKKPIIEVHLSNIFQRERFRHHSFISEHATGVICGFQAKSYTLALKALIDLLKN